MALPTFHELVRLIRRIEDVTFADVLVFGIVENIRAIVIHLYASLVLPD